MTDYPNGSRVVCKSCYNTVTLDGDLYKGGVWRGHAKGCERSVEFLCELGVKHDETKPDYSLLPLAALEPVVRVLEHGAKKYSPDNWKKVSPATRYFSAALRHLAAHQDGESLDKESGQLHLAHAAACLIFLVWHETREAGGK